MGFLKDLVAGLGQLTGGVIGGAINLVGELTDSKTMKEVGHGVYHATAKAGETLGTFASGTVDVVGGLITKDDKQIENGFGDMGTAVSDTYQGVKNGVVNVVDNGSKVIEGIKNDDFEAVKNGGANLLKTAAIATLAVGIADFVGVIGDDGVVDSAESVETNAVPEVGETVAVENPNTHHVDAHWVNGYDRADGTHVEGYWRDGDGDTSVNTNGGWTQHNPDYQAKV